MPAFFVPCHLPLTFSRFDPHQQDSGDHSHQTTPRALHPRPCTLAYPPAYPPLHPPLDPPLPSGCARAWPRWDCPLRSHRPIGLRRSARQKKKGTRSQVSWREPPKEGGGGSQLVCNSNTIDFFKRSHGYIVQYILSLHADATRRMSATELVCASPSQQRLRRSSVAAALHAP